MKKLISFVLVLAMVLGCVSMSFAAYSDMKDSKYANAVESLSSLGVVDGFADGTFGPEKTLTRAQMAKLLVAALALDPAGATGASFSDVAASAWYAPYVELAAQLDIVNGYPDGTFKPEKTVSNTEAIVMVVRALGYTDAYFGGYNAAKYINQAVALGLMGDVATGTASSTRGNAAQLLNNAIPVERVAIDKDGAAAKISGDSMQARLAGQLYNTGAAFVYLDSTEVAKGVNMAAYFGKNIVAYANKDGKIVGVKEVKSTTLTGKWNGTNFVVDETKYDLASGLNATNVAYIQNGIVASSATNTNLNGISNTTITIEAEVSGKTIKSLYSISKWTEAGTFVFAEGDYDAENFKLGGYTFAKNDNKELDTTKFSVFGIDKLDDLKKYDVVTVYRDPGDTYIVKVEVGTAKVEGKITEKTSAGKYVINGTAYATSSAVNATSIALGDKATFLLDYAGKIYTAKDLTTTTKYYGVLLEMQHGAKGINAKDAKVQLFTTDGTEPILLGDDVAAKDGAWAGYAATATNISTGVAVEYTLTEDGKVHSITNTAVVAGGPTAAAVLNNGLISASGLATYKFDANSLVINDKGNGKYDAIDAASLYGANTVTFKAIVADKGIVKFAFIENSVAATETYVLFNGYTEIAASPANYTQLTLFKGAVEDKTYKTKTDEVQNAAAATTAAVLRKLTVSGGYVTSAPAITAKAAFTVGTTRTSFSTNKDVMIVDTTLGDSGNFVLASDLVVYVWNTTDKVWTVGSVADLSLSSGAAVNLYATNSKTGEITYATVVK